MGMNGGYSNAPGGSAMKRAKILAGDAEKFRLGAEGERRTARVLRYFERNGWVVVHDLASGLGNIDHALVGPGGAFVLETKNWSGKVAVGDHNTVVRDLGGFERAHKSIGPETVARAMGLRSKISAITGVDRWVGAVVVWWADFPQGVVEDDSITWLDGDRLWEWLMGRTHRMNPAIVRRIGEALRSLPAPSGADPTFTRSGRRAGRRPPAEGGARFRPGPSRRASGTRS